MHKIKHFFSTIRLTTPSAIIISAIILAGSHLGYGFIMSNGSAPATPTTAFKGRTIDDTDLMTGNKKASVILVEYSDSECPFCAQLHPTIKKIQAEYASKLGFVYRYFPLTQIHPNSFEEARAIHCVGKSSDADKRQAYIDQMFDYKFQKQNMTLAKGQKESMAKAIGINDAQFTACMQSQESSDAITASIQDGVTAGVQGTPATFVLIKNRKGYEVVSLVDGARPYEFFKATIDDALAR
jgi:protein-disulfide isomerase